MTTAGCGGVRYRVPQRYRITHRHARGCGCRDPGDMDLGVCTEAVAAVRLRCYETLVRSAVVHKHLVHLRRDVRPARPARAPPHPSPLASCCQCGGAGPDLSGAPGVQVVHLYDGDSGECLVSRPAVHPLARPTRSPACREPKPEPEQSSSTHALTRQRWPQALLVARVADRVAGFAYDKVPCAPAPPCFRARPAAPTPPLPSPPLPRPPPTHPVASTHDGAPHPWS